jgi:hypothetical protein
MAVVGVVAAVLLATPACRESKQGGAAAGKAAKSPAASEASDRLTKPLGSRLLDTAWSQQTELHQIFTRKYDSTDKEGQKGLRGELDRVYFTKNSTISGYFEKAIEDDPGEPANYVSYGYYLQPRRDEFENSLKYIEKGITRDEENGAWHFLLANAYITPFRSGDFTRFGTADPLRWVRYKDKYEIEIARAGRLLPENWFVPYYDAVFRYNRDEDLAKAWGLVAEGNQRREGYFIFVPPLPLTITSWNLVPDRNQFFDLQWNFGFYRYQLIEHLADSLIKDDGFCADPEKMFGVMQFLYNAGATRPFDRLYHFQMGQALDALIEHYRGADDAQTLAKLEEAKKLYDSITETFVRSFDRANLPVTGAFTPNDPKLLMLERSARRQDYLIEPILKHDLRLLKQVREALGLSPEEHALSNTMWERE